MKRMVVLAGTMPLLLWGLAVFFLRDSSPSGQDSRRELHSKETAGVFDQSAVPAISSGATFPEEGKKKKKKEKNKIVTSEGDDFADSGGLMRLQQHFNAASRHIRPRMKENLFAESGLDTRENAESALRIMNESYPEEQKAEREQVRKKVLAMMLLGRSSFFSDHACLGLLTEHNLSLIRNPDMPMKVAVRLHIMELTRICGRKNLPATKDILDRAGHQDVVSQMRLGLQSLKEEV